MKCAKCDGQLAPVTVGGVTVDQCDKCSGIWMDFGELKKVLSEEDAGKLRGLGGMGEAHDRQKAACPRCGGDGTMVQLADPKHKDVHLDTCLVCYGHWLDGGELEKLRAQGLFETVAGFFKGLLGTS
jgi:Zn-finger nucleic acid-binding protein